MQVRYLKNTDIDRGRWDEVVSRSAHDLPYGHCWYLDVVSPGWEALVADDYEAVMPLTWNKKFGIRYLFQPWFTQQLGIFCRGECDRGTVKTFLEAVPETYRLIEIQLNENNIPEEVNFKVQEKKNYLLPLGASYNELYNGFSRNCRRNIKKASLAELSVKEGKDALQFTAFVYRQLSPEIENLGNKAIRLLKDICRISMATGKGELYEVKNPAGEIEGAGFFLKGSKRLIFQVCASSPEGKTLQTMTFLLNHVIEKYSGSGLVLDFSGSVMPGIAYFNSGFGAVPVSYYAVSLNRLPAIIRWLK